MKNLTQYKYIIVAYDDETHENKFFGFNDLQDAVNLHKNGCVFIKKGMMNLLEQQMARIQMEIDTVNMKLAVIKEEIELSSKLVDTRLS